MKTAKFCLLIVLALGFTFLNPTGTHANNKVMWGKTELKIGQIGKLTILEETPLLKLESNGSLSTIRLLKKGEEYRVYNYKAKNNGMYGIGSSSFVQKNNVVKYETPSRAKMEILEKLSRVDKGTNSHLNSIKNYALNGMIEATQKIKIGDPASIIQKTFGKPMYSWGMREYYVLEYPLFSVLYFGESDGSGEYPIINQSTEIYNITTKLNNEKGYTLKEIKTVFGNKVEVLFNEISGEYSIKYNLGKFNIFFEFPYNENRNQKPTDADICKVYTISRS